MLDQLFQFKMNSWLLTLLPAISVVASQVLFEELKAPSMHPRTFYLTPSQEYQLISKVLCEDIPCPEFSVIQDYPYFIQQRSYRAAKFLKLTAPRVCSFKATLDDGIQRLQKYRNGANNREEKYRNTLPLLIQVDQVMTTKSKNPWCHMSFSVNYYVPHYFGSIANPTEIIPDFLNVEDNLQVYVHTFDGDVEKVLLKEMELFRRNLDSLNICYKKMRFFVAIYEVPHSPLDSRIELWYLKCSNRR